MITIPQLDPVTTLADTDVVMVTHSDGTTEKLTGKNLKLEVKDVCIVTSSSTITGPDLKNGSMVKVLFTASVNGSDTITGMQITYNSTAYNVMARKDGSLVPLLAHEIATNTYKYLQSNTVFNLIFDGSQFIIDGNPVVLSSNDYTIFADGSKKVLFPDYLHPILNGALPSANGYTATEDCYVNIFFITTSTVVTRIVIEIDGVDVLSSDSSAISGVRTTIIHFSGFIKSGQIIKMKKDDVYIAPNAGVYAFPLI